MSWAQFLLSLGSNKSLWMDMVLIGKHQAIGIRHWAVIPPHVKRLRFAQTASTPEAKQTDAATEPAADAATPDTGKKPEAQKPKRWVRRAIKWTVVTMLAVIGLTPGTRNNEESQENHPVPMSGPMSPDPSKPVFIIHSGLGDRDNCGGSHIQSNLQLFAMQKNNTYNIQPGNIIVLDNIYPSLNELAGKKVSDGPGIVYNGWREGFKEVRNGRMPEPPILFKFIKSLWMYFSSSDPNADMIRKQHEQMARALEKRGLQKSEIVLIGHSAGGQMMLSICERNAQNKEQPYQIKSVILLGSPVTRNNNTPDVQVISVSSKNDGLVGFLEGAQNHVGLHPTQKHPGLGPHDLKIEPDDCYHMAYTWNRPLMEYMLEALSSNDLRAYAGGEVTRDGVSVRQADNGKAVFRTPEGALYVDNQRITGEGPKSFGEYVLSKSPTGGERPVALASLKGKPLTMPGTGLGDTRVASTTPQTTREWAQALMKPETPEFTVAVAGAEHIQRHGALAVIQQAYVMGMSTPTQNDPPDSKIPPPLTKLISRKEEDPFEDKKKATD
jgi:pimeloyl-ACP methyl ester carboxylesterase